VQDGHGALLVNVDRHDVVVCEQIAKAISLGRANVEEA
jgi:hypothetical protein